MEKLTLMETTKPSIPVEGGRTLHPVKNKENQQNLMHLSLAYVFGYTVFARKVMFLL